MIRPGERIALLGQNAVGKTTLIKTIISQYQSNTEDIARFNPQSNIAYCDQALALLDPSQTLMSYLRENCSGADSDLKSALIRADFPYCELEKPVAVLSGGEKARLMFLIMKLNQPNFLILDEPTNHIDIQGKEELEDQILTSNATVLVTSHDQRFIDHIAQRLFLISNGRLVKINHPDTFYQMDPVENPAKIDVKAEQVSARSEEETLARIIELEELLAEDQARKPEFQKPEMQADWQAQLVKLNAQLDS